MTEKSTIERDAERYRLLRLYDIVGGYDEQDGKRQLPCATIAWTSNNSIDEHVREEVLDLLLDKMLGYEKSMNFHTPEILKAIREDVAMNVDMLTKKDKE